MAGHTWITLTSTIYFFKPIGNNYKKPYLVEWNDVIPKTAYCPENETGSDRKEPEKTSRAYGKSGAKAQKGMKGGNERERLREMKKSQDNPCRTVLAAR